MSDKCITCGKIISAIFSQCAKCNPNRQIRLIDFHIELLVNLNCHFHRMKRLLRFETIFDLSIFDLVCWSFGYIGKHFQNNRIIVNDICFFISNNYTLTGPLKKVTKVLLFHLVILLHKETNKNYN